MRYSVSACNVDESWTASSFFVVISNMCQLSWPQMFYNLWKSSKYWKSTRIDVIVPVKKLWDECSRLDLDSSLVLEDLDLLLGVSDLNLLEASPLSSAHYYMDHGHWHPGQVRSWVVSTDPEPSLVWTSVQWFSRQSFTVLGCETPQLDKYLQYDLVWGDDYLLLTYLDFFLLITLYVIYSTNRLLANNRFKELIKKAVGLLVRW